MPKSIQLTRYAPVYKGDMIGYLMEVRATAPVDMPSQIFVYHRGPVDPGTGDFQDVYEAVASPSQLDEIPVGAPVTPPEGLTQIPYYRSDILQFMTRTLDEADELWAIVQQDANSLVKALNAADSLESVATVTITGA